MVNRIAVGIAHHDRRDLSPDHRLAFRRCNPTCDDAAFNQFDSDMVTSVKIAFPGLSCSRNGSHGIFPAFKNVDAVGTWQNALNSEITLLISINHGRISASVSTRP